MSEAQTAYGVSYIAEAPQELKVGDRVEVVNDVSPLFGQTGQVLSILDGYATIEFEHDVFERIRIEALRKLTDTDNPFEKQVGGNHYKDMAIQPIEFSMKNGLNACQHSIIKYICRYKHKNGKEDLLKAKHFIDLLIQLEYPE